MTEVYNELVILLLREEILRISTQLRQFIRNSHPNINFTTPNSSSADKPREFIFGEYRKILLQKCDHFEIKKLNLERIFYRNV